MICLSNMVGFHSYVQLPRGYRRCLSASKSLSQRFRNLWKRDIETRNPGCFSDVCNTLSPLNKSFPVDCYVIICSHSNHQTQHISAGDCGGAPNHSISKLCCKKNPFCCGTLSILKEKSCTVPPATKGLAACAASNG